MFRLAIITVLAGAAAFAQSPGVSSSKSFSQSTATQDRPYVAIAPRVVLAPIAPGFRVPLCTGFPHSHSPSLVVQGSSMHVRMPRKPVKR